MNVGPDHPRSAMAALALVAISGLCFAATLQGEFIWDDDANVSLNPALRSLEGLRLLWVEPGTMTQYYPLLYTTFWLEYAVFGLDPVGYHATNVLLHSINAVLLWRILVLLAVPGAWLAALVFAIHPVQVETVAWITELKNIQSGLFYLASALAYLHFDAGRDRGRPPWGLYALSLLLFAGAVLSKNVTATLPGALLLIRWFKAGRLTVSDGLLILPMLAVLVPIGWLSAGREVLLGVNRGWVYDASAIERLLIAGRAFWFYLGTLAWPSNLSFIHPRFAIEAGAVLPFAFPVAAIALPVVLFGLRHRIGRGPATAVLYFLGTILPALGFLEIYFLRFSYVADHWQYLACIGPIALASSGVARLAQGSDRRRWIVRVAAACAVVALFALSVRHSRVFRDNEVLFRDVVEKNPTSELARYNLALILGTDGRLEEAEEHLRYLLEIDPANAQAITAFGYFRMEQGDVDGAIARFEQAIALAPLFIRAHWNLGLALERQGRVDEAIDSFQRALAIDLEEAIAWVAQSVDRRQLARHHAYVGRLLLDQGRTGEAVRAYEQALELDPFFAAGHVELGIAFVADGQARRAMSHFEAALAVDPGNRAARENLEQMRKRISARQRALQGRP